MNNKQLILILIAIIVGACIIGAFIYLGLNANENNVETNITTNVTENKNTSNITEDVDYSTQTTTQESSAKQYEDWQVDYETGEYDDEGKPIYRSVASTSGGQVDPGIYESYWSENGPISEKRIG